jgi:TfoX/Sxy family transcriptional regulator of competence genes
MSDQVLEERFAGLAKRLARTKGVTMGSGKRGFGSDALQVDGRIFAMLRRGGLILKLPKERVAELIANGEGSAFDAGKGKPMKEWITVGPSTDARWLALAREALAFVRAT